MSDPRVKALSKPGREFIEQALPFLLEPVGVQTIANELGYSPSGAYYHLRNLVARQILVAIPKRDKGSYHRYKLNVNGAA